MTPYLFLIMLSLAGGLLPADKPGYRRGFLLMTGTSCWLLAALRYVTGFDYRFYESIFQTVSSADLSSLTNLEPGYLLLNLLVARMGGEYHTFLLLFHLLLTALIFVWIGRYSSAPWLSIYLFVTLQYFALSMNFLRQSLAAAILLWLYPFLRSRRPLPCCGLILFASCFHRTALIMLPLSLLLCLRVSRRHYGLSALTAAAAYFLIDPLLQLAVTLFPKYQSYLGGKYWQGNSFVYVLLPLGCFLFSLPLLCRALHEPDKPPVLINGIFYTLLLQTFITRHFILERLSIYLAFFSLLALPEAALLPGERRLSRVRTWILIAGGLAYFLFAVNQGFHGVYPYRGLWDRSLTP